MLDLIAVKREAISELLHRHPVRRLCVFWPTARGNDYEPGRSDVDLVVEVASRPYLESVADKWALRATLVRLLGLLVDLLREGSLVNPSLFRQIAAQQEIVYAA